MKKAALILCLLLTCVLVCACGRVDGHAPGYGNTSKCTICNKPATHKSANYGFCDKHWENAMNYGR